MEEIKTDQPASVTEEAGNRPQRTEIPIPAGQREYFMSISTQLLLAKQDLVHLNDQAQAVQDKIEQIQKNRALLEREQDAALKMFHLVNDLDATWGLAPDGTRFVKRG